MKQASNANAIHLVHLRMEDAVFNKKSATYIYKIRDDKDEQIKAGKPYLFQTQPWFPIANSNHCTASTSINLPQAAIEDIDNASSTVKGWKSRWGLTFDAFSENVKYGVCTSFVP